jgi:hypothetical protein
MHLVQLLLPVRDDEGRPFDRALFDDLSHELTDRFGGLTAYTRAPAAGLWEEPSGGKQRDDIVVYEVMVEHLDDQWWSALRRRLESQFRQRELVIRAQEMRRL